MIRCLVLLALLMSVSKRLLAEERPSMIFLLSAQGDTLAAASCVVDSAAFVAQDGPNPVIKKFKKRQRLNKRITAAVLAFPFPFGIVGLHRIYLGTMPYVPVAYVASLGGVFGILPFIDFCAITFDGKNFEHYRDNGQVFMWLNH